LYGAVQEIPQTESTPFYPRSPYGVAKLFAHWMTINYRESYHMFTCCGILFNHESPLRGKEFVTRKITDAVAKIRLGQQACLELGNLDAKRDWGYAKEYVEGMYLMMQSQHADTFVLATGRSETVREFVRLAFKAADIELVFKETGDKEYALDMATGKQVLRVNPQFYRPAEVDLLIGDARKAQSLLGWQAKTNLETLCDMMVRADIKRIQDGCSF
jgi:GDPmannose 4,6-dehydratase